MAELQQAAAGRASWARQTPEQRAQRIRRAQDARSRNARSRKIAELIEGAPPFTPEQRARLCALLNAHPVTESGAAS